MNVRSDVRKVAKWRILDYMSEKIHEKKIVWEVGRDVSFYTMTTVGDYVDDFKTKELCFDNVIISSSHWDNKERD